ncbi:SWIM zinc finger family protein [Amycolatopsis sp. lyj-109]|uniref:SWIM zinc finger family protein n=1 Tax=Amycolatopsis sp. lyj-109 TaxID=2789287 RepID=UPI0039795814
MTTDLLLAPPERATEAPAIFDGLLDPGVQAAQALLVLGRIARTRFYLPPNMVRRMIAESDPVFSADGQTLRAESFSPCCGVHARLDVQPSGRLSSGCTNVDLGEATRAALAKVVGTEPLHLTVRGDGIRLRTLDGAESEDRVPLPSRWVAGFAEIAAITATATRRADLGQTEARTFLRRLPTTGTMAWAVPSGRSLRLTARGGPEAIPATGLHRLRVVEPMIRFIQGLSVYAAPGGESASWVLQLARARLSVTLSPAPARGFSGEGGWLTALSAGLDAPELVSGQSGHDLVTGAWFARPLPSGGTPAYARLTKARALVEAGAVRALPAGGYEIAHGESLQRVRLDPAGCTCSWWAEHQERRGPCSHLLAARLSAGQA